MKERDHADGSSPPAPPGAGEDRIGALLRATGRRPPVPADRADRVKEAVRAHWQAELARRSRRRRWQTAALAAAAMVVAAVGVAIWQRGRAPAGLPDAARVEVIVAGARLRPDAADPDARPAPLGPDDAIAAGSGVETEPGGRLALRMASGHSLRLDAGTRVRLVSGAAVELEHGALYVDSRGPAGAATGPLEIRTALGRVRDVGTQFEVRLTAASLTVRVREGRVALDGAGPTLDVAAGQELELGADGRVMRRDLAGIGAPWAWIGEVTPMMEIEGRSLREFLDWVARERGLRLQFADDALAGAAGGIALNGSIRGMTLDQALESVLPTCRMTHRIERDVLRVEALRDVTDPAG